MNHTLLRDNISTNLSTVIYIYFGKNARRWLLHAGLLLITKELLQYYCIARIDAVKQKTSDASSIGSVIRFVFLLNNFERLFPNRGLTLKAEKIEYPSVDFHRCLTESHHEADEELYDHEGVLMKTC